jgi:hypothetical protein
VAQQPTRYVLRCAALRCAVLRCAVLCCAVLCCAVLCCAVLCCAVLCCAVPCCAVLCCAVLCCAVPSCAVRQRVAELAGSFGASLASALPCAQDPQRPWLLLLLCCLSLSVRMQAWGEP